MNKSQCLKTAAHGLSEKYLRKLRIVPQPGHVIQKVSGETPNTAGKMPTLPIYQTVSQAQWAMNLAAGGLASAVGCRHLPPRAADRRNRQTLERLCVSGLPVHLPGAPGV